MRQYSALRLYTVALGSRKGLRHRASGAKIDVCRRGALPSFYGRLMFSIKNVSKVGGVERSAPTIATLGGRLRLRLLHSRRARLQFRESHRRL